MTFTRPLLLTTASWVFGAIVVLGCGGCWTPAVWQGGGGTRVEVMEVVGATRSVETGNAAALVVRCEGRGLARGDWFALVPLEDGASVDPTLERHWSGLTLAELDGFETAAQTRASKRALSNATAIRRKVRVSRQAPADLIGVVGRIEPWGDDHVLVAYWPPGAEADVPMVVRAAWLDEAAARAFIQRVLGDDRAWREYEANANLVNIVHRPDWRASRPPHVALLPRTLLRPLGQRVGATAGAVALTPLALAGDAVGVVVGVVTAPIWIPVTLIAFDRMDFGGTGPDPGPAWHPPLALPEARR